MVERSSNSYYSQRALFGGVGGGNSAGALIVSLSGQCPMARDKSRN
jgi:hypothetical protein